MKILSWGSNSHGQLSQGIQSEQIVCPTKIDFRGDVKQITGGGKHTVIVLKSGSIFTCGDNDRGQLCMKQSNKELMFQALPLQIKITKVSCGWDFNLALSEELEVYGWGSNSFGQLSLPQKHMKFSNSALKVFDQPALDISCGLRHSAVINKEGSLFTTGSCKKQQLGFNVTESNLKFVDKFTQVPEIFNAKKISCGENHCLMLTKDLNIFAWGDNKFGQLGVDPVCLSITTPTLLPFQTEKIKDIFSGWSHNAVLTENGDVFNWGRSDYGQLGEKRTIPWKIKVLKNIPKIRNLVTGSHHTLALSVNGELFSWGWNEHGNCGNNSLENVFEPVKVHLQNDVEPLIIGSGAAHNFACFN